ncbi:putative ribonuclease H-like domain-containing protein [Tanacetum coccineum]
MTTLVLLVRKESNTRPLVRPKHLVGDLFLRTKDETSAILKDFIRQIENQLNQKVKTIRCDNGTEFKNRDVIEFCGSKGIRGYICNARTPPQNGGKGPTWLFDLDYLTDSMNYHPISSENQANLHACQQEANQNAALTTDDKIEGPREEEQVFMDELERLKRQEKEANKEAESLRKNKASSTNRVNTVSLPVSTASSFEGLSLSDPTNPEEDDSEIPPLEDIYQNSTDGDPTSAVQTRSKLHKVLELMLLLAIIISEALEDESWVDAMQEELFASIEIQKVLGHSRFALITEAIGHRQEEGIDYDESYQMDVKSAFLYGKINEEVYVTHHQDRRGTIDKTLILKKDKLGYHTSSSLCDDIIFGSTKNSCYEFEALRKEYISDELPWQDKYVAKILKKIDFANVKTASTPIETQKPLVKDEEASDVDVHLYRSMIGSLIVLDSSRPRHYVCSLWLVLDSDYAEQILTGNPHRRLSNSWYHFIRDAYEKKLIQVLKIHTDDNVADLLTKAFDVSSPVVSTTFVEQFWTSAKSKTINNVRHITAKVAGKSVSIYEASIRSDLLFDDC